MANYTNTQHVDVQIISPPSYYTNDPPPGYTEFYSQQPRKINFPQITSQKRFIYCKIVIGILVATAVVLALALLILYGLIPCQLSRCHSRASICINRPFRAQCICDYGYVGNGKDYCDECGLTAQSPNLRIIGGIDAVANSWPSAVLIIQSYTGEYRLKGQAVLVTISFLCGGVLTNHKTVLTASHCMKDSFEHMYQGVYYQLKITPNKYYTTWESMFTVYVGIQNRRQTSSDATGVGVDMIIKNDKFDPVFVRNDIAILKLKTIVKPSTRTQYACLPPKRSATYPSPNTKAYIVGWGTTTVGGPLSQTLKNANITVYEPLKYCANVFPMVQKNWDSQICAGEYLGGRDSCQGDSGGPLYIKENFNGSIRYVAGGIVSYGDDCALRRKPGIYTRTSYFLDWITKHSDFS